MFQVEELGVRDVSHLEIGAGVEKWLGRGLVRWLVRIIVLVLIIVVIVLISIIWLWLIVLLIPIIVSVKTQTTVQYFQTNLFNIAILLIRGEVLDNLYGLWSVYKT